MILRFLWALLGRDEHEGGNPNIGTEPNYLRTLAQVGNLPVVMIECEGFSLENLKSSFNGCILRATAKKDHSNETYTPKFRGALVISQNERAITKGSKLNREALLSRLVFVNFDKSRHTSERAVKARKLEQMGVKELSGFLVEALKREQRVLEILQETFECNRLHIVNLNIREGRIGLTHGLMQSLVEALSLILPITIDLKNEVFSYIDQIAIERDSELQKDHPPVEQFWEVYECLNSYGYNVNHSKDPDYIV